MTDFGRNHLQHWFSEGLLMFSFILFYTCCTLTRESEWRLINPKNDCITSWWIYSKNHGACHTTQIQHTAINMAALKGYKTRANINWEYFLHEPETWLSEVKHEPWRERPPPECSHATVQQRVKLWTYDAYVNRNCFLLRAGNHCVCIIWKLE